MELMDYLNRDKEFKTVVVYNKSPKYFDLILTMLKKRYSVEGNDVFLLTSLSEVTRNSDLISVSPLSSEKWIFYIEDTASFLTNEAVKLLANAPNTVLLVGVSNYGSYIRWKRGNRFNSLNITFDSATRLTKNEFEWLYRKVIKGDKAEPLPVELVDYLKKYYLTLPESIFTLFSAIKNGIPFKTKNDLISLIGVGSIRLESQLVGLLNANVRTERGLNMFLSRRGSAFVELCLREGVRKVQRELISLLKAMLDLRYLRYEGKIIDGVPVILEGIYDTNHHKRLLYYMEKAWNIPNKKIILLLDILDKEPKWTDESQVIGFLYKYIYTLQIARERGFQNEISRKKHQGLQRG